MGDLPRLSELAKVPGAGTAFVRMVKALILAKGDVMSASVIAESKWPLDSTLHAVLKTAVTAGTLGGGTWGSGLHAYNALSASFITALRSQSVLQRLTAQKVPFGVRIPRTLGSTTVGFVGETKPKSVSEMNFDYVDITRTKVSGISVVSQELARSADPSAEDVLKADLVASIAAMVDTKLLDPASIAVSGVSPASITSGTTAVTSSGSTALLIAGDLEAVIDRILTAGGVLADPVWIAKPWVLAKLAAKTSTTGGPAFPAVRVSGGTLLGIPCIASTSAPGSTSGGNTIVLVDQSELLIAQEAIEVSVSGESAIQMDSAPSPSASNLIALWQSDLVAVRVEQYCGWFPRRSAAMTAAYLDGLAL